MRIVLVKNRYICLVSEWLDSCGPCIPKYCFQVYDSKLDKKNKDPPERIIFGDTGFWKPTTCLYRIYETIGYCSSAFCDGI